MQLGSIGAAAAALTLGFALLATPATAAPISSGAAIIAPDSPVISVARKGVRRGPVIIRGPIIRRGPVVIRRGPVIVGPGVRLGRVAQIRRGWFVPGRRIWVLPAIGAAAVALTLAPGWYWGAYQDDCHRWIIPCPGCAPRLVDLCAPY
jgi:hypothetical protein